MPAPSLLAAARPRARVISQERLRSGASPHGLPVQPLSGDADCESMARWRAFVDVLDELITEPHPTPTARATARTDAAPRFVPVIPFYAPAASAMPNQFWARPGPYAPAAQPARPTKARALTPAQERAFQTLLQLGAHLERGFSVRDLKRAFRSLAQRYHPDRHPGATDAERARLGASFADLASAYGVLLEPARQ